MEWLCMNKIEFSNEFDEKFSELNTLIGQAVTQFLKKNNQGEKIAADKAITLHGSIGMCFANFLVKSITTKAEILYTVNGKIEKEWVIDICEQYIDFIREAINHYCKAELNITKDNKTH